MGRAYACGVRRISSPRAAGPRAKHSAEVAPRPRDRNRSTAVENRLVHRSVSSSLVKRSCCPRFREIVRDRVLGWAGSRREVLPAETFDSLRQACRPIAQVCALDQEQLLAYELMDATSLALLALVE